MRLWSTVLKKPGTPGASSQRSSSSSSTSSPTSSSGSSVTAIGLLLQALEVFGEGGQVTLRERTERGHRDPRFDPWRVPQPLRHVPGRVLDGSGAEGAA